MASGDVEHYAAFLIVKPKENYPKCPRSIDQRKVDIDKLKVALEPCNFSCEETIIIDDDGHLERELRRLTGEVEHGGMLLVFISAEGVNANDDLIYINGNPPADNLKANYIKQIFERPIDDRMYQKEKVFIVQADYDPPPPTTLQSDSYDVVPVAVDFRIYWNNIPGSVGLDTLCEVLKDKKGRMTMDAVMTEAREKITSGDRYRHAIVFKSDLTATKGHEI